MKNKLLFMILVLFIITMHLSAQVIKTEFYLGKNIVKASVDNLITMYNLTTAQWETEMKKLTDYKGPYYNPAVEYTASNGYPAPVSFFTHSVLKSPNMVEIMCIHFDSASIMINLYNELEPYYTAYEDKMQVFTIKKNGVIYKFYLTRATGNDMVIIGSTSSTKSNSIIYPSNLIPETFFLGQTKSIIKKYNKTNWLVLTDSSSILGMMYCYSPSECNPDAVALCDSRWLEFRNFYFNTDGTCAFVIFTGQKSETEIKKAFIYFGWNTSKSECKLEEINGVDIPTDWSFFATNNDYVIFTNCKKMECLKKSIWTYKAYLYKKGTQESLDKLYAKYTWE